MAFNLAALGAGLGQFAQDYQRQQEQAKQTMMLKMQLERFQQEQQERQRQDQVKSTLFGAILGGGQRGSAHQTWVAECARAAR